jgi:hypothetical protein
MAQPATTPAPRTVEVPALTREATFVPASIDREKRTVELVWSTGAQVRRFDWSEWTPFEEELSLEPEHCDLARLKSRAPLLDTHQRFSVSGILGVTEKAWLETGEGRAVVRFSKRSEVEPIWRDVQDGIITGVSIGYHVRKYLVTKEEGKLPVYRAVDWYPYEISLCPSGADAGAGVRSNPAAPSSRCELVDVQERSMDPKDQVKAPATQSTPPAPPAATASAPAVAAPAPAPAPVAAPAPAPVAEVRAAAPAPSAEAPATPEARIIAAARSITGETDLARVEGVLYALRDATRAAETLRAENATLKAQLAERSAPASAPAEKAPAAPEGKKAPGRIAAEVLVDEAVRSFKVAPTQRDSILDLAGPEGERLETLRAYLERAVPVMGALPTPPGSGSSPSSSAPSAPEAPKVPVVLTAEERSIAERCGVTPEAYAAAKSNQRVA